MNLMEIKAQLNVSSLGGDTVVNEDGTTYFTPDADGNPTDVTWIRRWYDKAEFGTSFSVSMVESLAEELMNDINGEITTLGLRSEDATGPKGAFTKHIVVKFKPQKFNF